MAANIKQKLIKLFKNMESTEAGKLNLLIKRLQQKDIVFPNDADGIDRACLLAAYVFYKNRSSLFNDKAQIEANEKQIKEFSKSLGLLSNEPELEQKNSTRPTRKRS